MTENEEEDIRKIFDAVKNIKKTLQCTLCKYLPTDASASKCGHPFCGSCIEKVLNTRKAVCSICKTLIVRSSVHKVGDIGKTIRDLETLAAAIFRDSGSSYASALLLDRGLDESEMARQYPGKRKSGQSQSAQASSSKDNIFSEDQSMPKPKRPYRRSSEVRDKERRKSFDSEETVKIHRKKLEEKNENQTRDQPSTSKASDGGLGIFCSPAVNFPAKVETLEPYEKVNRWLEKSSSNKSVSDDSPMQHNEAENSTANSQNPQYFSQKRPSWSRASLNSRSESPLICGKSLTSKSPKKKTKDISQKYSRESGLKNDSQSGCYRATTLAEEMFDELCSTKPESKKSTVHAAATEDSWSELDQFKKETRSRVRKRRRLKISIGKPDNAKRQVESEEDSKEEQNIEPTDRRANDTSNKSTEVSGEMEVERNRSAGKTMPTIVSSITLEKKDMIKIPTLNRREVKEIIGAPLTESDLDRSKNSNVSPEKLMKAQPSLRNSRDFDEQDVSNESLPPNTPPEENKRSNSVDNVIPQSSQSFHLSKSRPNSRISTKGTANATPEKFQLSLNRKSLSPNKSPCKVLSKQEIAEAEKIVIDKTSPVRSCNDFDRSKLTLRTKSCDGEKKIIPIQKLGRLCKPRNKIKFVKLGPIKPPLVTRKLQFTSTAILMYNSQTQTSPRRKNASLSTQIGLCDVETQTESGLPCNPQTRTSPRRKNASLSTHIGLRDVETQTEPGLNNADNTRYCSRKQLRNNELLIGERISGTRSSSVVSSDSEKRKAPRGLSVNSAGRTTSSFKSNEEVDEVNEVELLSPGKDSQLKFFDAESPNVARVDSSDVMHTEDTEESFRAEGGESSSNFMDGILQPPSSKYMKEVKKYANKLIVTDSEDPDTPSESFGRKKSKNNRRGEIGASDKIDMASSSKRNCQNNAGGSENVIEFDKPSSINSERILSHALPMMKRSLKESSGSRSAKKSQSEASTSNHTKCYASDAETIVLPKTTNKKETQPLEDSEPLIPNSNSKHKVVRKLQYSQESTSSLTAQTGKSRSSSRQAASEKQSRIDDLPGKKPFQRICPVSSTDSEEELVVSLTPKHSGSIGSEKTLKLEPSQAPMKSLLPSEEMSVEFSSNRDSPEPKRKRTLSLSSPENVDLEAIASNWCDDLNRSSQEIAVESAKVLEANSRQVLKKPKFEKRGSSASYSSDSFPSIDVNTERKSTKSNSELEKAKNQTPVNILEKSQSSRPSSAARSISEKNNENSLNANVENVDALHFGSRNSFPKNNSRCVSPPSNIEMGDTLNGLETPEKSSTPARTSHNANKENEVEISKPKSLVERSAGFSKNVGKKIAPCENLGRAKIDTISNNVSQTKKTADNTTEFDSCFDQDLFNITQEERLLQEVEDNLLGRNYNRKTSQSKTEKRVQEDAEVTLLAEKPSLKKVAGETGRSDAITEPDSDDSLTMKEDIVESTPQKNCPQKKDLLAYADCSQRSTMSRKSFMSVDMTPIPKRLGVNLQRTSEISPLVERCASGVLVQQDDSSSTGSARLSCHSTPKPGASIVQRVNSLPRSGGVDERNPGGRRLCFITSCLPLKQVDKIKLFARQHHAEFTANYKPEVTHVIVQANESNSASKTVKYLLGIAHKKWIVSYRWVTDSMSQGRLLEEAEYEVVDSDTLKPGAMRSRLRERGLFENFAFICMNPIPKITASQIENLIISTGGTMAQSVENLASQSRKYRIFVYSSDSTDENRLENVRRRGGIVPVPVEWIVTCISQYELESLHSFVQPQDFELAVNLEFPPELIVEVEESCSESEESNSGIDK